MGSHESFWNFSIRVYGRPEVRARCLSLQNLHGLDVNLLLFACWHGYSRGNLDRDTLKQTLTFSRAWSEQVVRPLRMARTWMKTNPGDRFNALAAQKENFEQLRQQIKQNELDCEHVQQDALESMVSISPRTLTESAQHHAAVNNLAFIIEASAVTLTAAEMESFAAMVLSGH